LTTLYIRHPARAEGEGALCSFAVVGDDGAIVQKGEGALRNLSDLVPASRRVVLLLAGADVTLLSVQAPPLSGARLKAALPGLVEESILGEPGDQVLVAAPLQGDGRRPVAVVQRDWFEALVRMLPAQLCLPLQPGSVTAAIGGGELTLRQSLFQGLGLALDGSPAVALQTARALAGDVPLVLYVPPEQLGEYQALASEAGPGTALEADDWVHWIAGARSTGFDLVPGLGAAGAPSRDLCRWRWPIVLTALAVLVNLAGMNIEWLRLRAEANAIRQTMTQTFRAAYPNEPAIDPVAQMRQHIARAKANTGQLAPDEFTYMAAALGEALATLGRPVGIASIEYRERALNVKVKPDTADPSVVSRLKTAMAARGMSLEEAGPAAWIVRSTGGKQ
jgi:general secretion pathway protein L